MNPHDKLFKEIESVKENAVDFIETFFPADVLKQLDLNTLSLDKNSYIDENLKEYYTDLVYNCKNTKNVEIKISLLFEHKSYKPSNEYLQLLRYILNVWTYEDKNKKKLSLVVPVIFYHGKEKWEKRSITDFFEGLDEVLYKFLPKFEYIFTNINNYDDEKIKKGLFKRDFNKVMAMMFKYIQYEDTLCRKLPEIFTLVKDHLDNEEKQRKLISFVYYIIELTELPEKEISDILNDISQKGGDIIMTTAAKLRNEGKQVGLQEGKQEGLQEKSEEAARNMLSRNYPIEEVMEITGLSREKVERLKSEIE